MPRVVHFEIHASNPDAAVAFYGGLFGWKFTKYAGPQEYWLIETGAKEEPGINGGLVKRMGPAADSRAMTPVTSFVCTIDVASVDQAIVDIKKAGGSIALEKQAVPGLAWLAYAKDPDGNIFGIYQTDANAK